MTTLLLDCVCGSTKEGFANAARALAPDTLPPIDSYVSHARTSLDIENSHSCASELDAHTSYPHEHHHHSMHEVYDTIDAAPVTDAVKAHTRGVYELIAAAEAKAHNVSVAEVHVHEVGNPDAIAHILAACDALSRISFDRVIATPVCTGFGTVQCAHGLLPIPAPATANILEGIPTFAGEKEGERTTPTGAALVVYFADEFATEAVEVQNLGADIVLCCNPC